MEQPRGGVDQRGYGGLVARHPAVDDDIQGRVAFDLDRVVRVRGIEIHPQIQRQADPAVHRGLGVLVEAASLAFLHRKMLRADVMVGHDGVTRFDDVLHRPAQAMGDEREGFLQARVAGFALLEQVAGIPPVAGRCRSFSAAARAGWTR